MMYLDYYWRQDKNAPFAFFLTVIDTYLHPESGFDVDDLAAWLREGEPQEELLRFKDEFRQLLSGDLDQLPHGALGTAAEFDDGADEAFLQRLWHDLYGAEPVQAGKPASS
jgi:hypothetical protein